MEQKALIDYLDTILAAVSLDRLVELTCNFLVSEFNLSNCSVFFEDRKFMFLPRNYDVFEQGLFAELREFRNIIFKKTGAGLPGFALAVPLVVDKEFLGAFVLYSEFGFDDKDTVDVISQKFLRAASIAKEFQSSRECAARDYLTGLCNRTALNQLSNEVSKDTCVLMLDIDDFKKFNDEQGHLAGDDILARFGKCILSWKSAVDVCVRYGGEEFLIKTEGEVGSVVKRADLLRETVFKECGLSISVGVASCLDLVKFSDLVAQADKALYRAKHTGKNRVVSFVLLGQGKGVVESS